DHLDDQALRGVAGLDGRALLAALHEVGVGRHVELALLLVWLVARDAAGLEDREDVLLEADGLLVLACAERRRGSGQGHSQAHHAEDRGCESHRSFSCESGSDYYTPTGRKRRIHARRSWSTRPWTSVSRRSRPPKRKVSASWSRPSR